MLIELLWGKRRIIEVYLNVAEFDEGVFGANAGAETYFGKAASSLSASQSARLMTVLPNPRGRSAAAPASPSSGARRSSPQALQPSRKTIGGRAIAGLELPGSERHNRSKSKEPG